MSAALEACRANLQRAEQALRNYQKAPELYRAVRPEQLEADVTMARQQVQNVTALVQQGLA